MTVAELVDLTLGVCPVCTALPCECPDVLAAQEGRFWCSECAATERDGCRHCDVCDLLVGEDDLLREGPTVICQACLAEHLEEVRP